jgi:hypothetical protein
LLTSSPIDEALSTAPCAKAKFVVTDVNPKATDVTINAQIIGYILKFL